MNKSNATIRPEKLYTQNDVDNLLDNKIKQDKQIVANLVKKSNRILVSISGQFPFDFFPDVINVEDGRITVIKRHMLGSEVHSVDIKDISNIFINNNIFFSQLIIVSKTFEENEVKIRFLKNKEAIFVRRIIEGLRVFNTKQIDTSAYTAQELVSKLEELSTTKIVT